MLRVRSSHSSRHLQVNLIPTATYLNFGSSYYSRNTSTYMKALQYSITTSQLIQLQLDPSDISLSWSPLTICRSKIQSHNNTHEVVLRSLLQHYALIFLSYSILINLMCTGFNATLNLSLIIIINNNNNKYIKMKRAIKRLMKERVKSPNLREHISITQTRSRKRQLQIRSD